MTLDKLLLALLPSSLHIGFVAFNGLFLLSNCNYSDCSVSVSMVIVFMVTHQILPLCSGISFSLLSSLFRMNTFLRPK